MRKLAFLLWMSCLPLLAEEEPRFSKVSDENKLPNAHTQADYRLTENSSLTFGICKDEEKILADTVKGVFMGLRFSY